MNVSKNLEYIKAQIHTPPRKPPAAKKLIYNDIDLRLAKEFLIMVDKVTIVRQRKDIDKHWAHELGLMHRSDGVKYSQIEAVMRYAHNDDFWKSNILSPHSLRKNFSKLYARMSNSVSKDDWEKKLASRNYNKLKDRS
jgi:hypothetical protein